MARAERKLTARTVASLTKPGVHGDGRGLWLQVSPSGTKAWLFRYMLNGRSREMGLGPVADVTLADAREAAADARRLLREGVDPIEARKARRMGAALEAARAVSFRDAADRYIEAHKAGWKSDKHAAQWSATLETYVHPVFGAVPVAAVDVGLVLKVLEPIWSTKAETASRVRGRIEVILDWAKVRGYREGENPARWRGHLDKLLPARSKVRKVAHHAALPYDELFDFMVALRAQAGTAARALEFAILTAARTNEVLGATWGEIDLDGARWTVPADRMKGGREHRVPLAEPALALLRTLARENGTDGHVFPGQRRGHPLSNMALLMTLRRMGRGDLTAHGFRSTFRDWVAERTRHQREVAEAALAHAVGDRVEAAYLRGDMYEKRARMMAEWAAFCGTAPVVSGTVVSILGPA